MAKSVISGYHEITATDTVVFAIPVDSVDSQADLVKQYEIPYVHLSDQPKTACQKSAATNIAGPTNRIPVVIDTNGLHQYQM